MQHMAYAAPGWLTDGSLDRTMRLRRRVRLVARFGDPLVATAAPTAPTDLDQLTCRVMLDAAVRPDDVAMLRRLARATPLERLVAAARRLPTDDWRARAIRRRHGGAAYARVARGVASLVDRVVIN